MKIENLTFFINFNKWKMTKIYIQFSSFSLSFSCSKKPRNSSNYFDQRNRGGIIDIYQFDFIKITPHENRKFILLYKLYITNEKWRMSREIILFRDKREKLIDDGSKWSSVSNTLNMDPENLLPVNPPLVGPQ